MRTGQDRYQQLAAARLKTARLSANWTVDRLAESLSEVLGIAVAPRQLTLWEDGDEPFYAGVIPASYDVLGISEADMIGLGNPDAAQINRLAIAVTRVRGLLNDPAALMRRATDLLEGTAKPILGLGLAFAALIGWGFESPSA